jgi:hypothetical protein
VLGVFLNRTEPDQADAIQSVGGVFLAIGVLLLYVRSLLRESPDR